MTLLHSTGLNTNALEALLAAALGDAPGEEGAKLLGEALDHGRFRVTLPDVIYCLARTPGTQLNKRFILRSGQSPEDFVDAIESGLDEPDAPEDLPLKLNSDSVTQDVRDAFQAAEDLTRKHGLPKVSDTTLSLALLSAAEEELTDLLRAWVSDEQYDSFTKQLSRALESKPTQSLFAEDGKLLMTEFGPSGHSFIKRLIEDAASLKARSISLRHMLYTLLGLEQSLLSRSLFILGADIKAELHAPLARQLTRSGGKRSELKLARDAFLETTVRVLERARQFAGERDGRILEGDISLAFADRAERELSRILVGVQGFNIDDLKSVLQDAEVDADDEDDSPLQKLSLNEMESRIKSAICGQDQAIEAVMPWIKRLRFGLPRDGRPAGVFLFLGPTGTGKTQLAKELARYVFGDEEQIIFLEMGQFKTKESMNMFIGAPPGYTGYGEGILTNGLRDKPEAVVLFDEIEKADTQVFDTLLRFADEGLISDPAGPVRDGRKCLIVMTTNAGQGWLRTELQSNPTAVDNLDVLARQLFEAAMAELAEKGFRPEFLGRLDERITYVPFSLESCRQIVDLVLAKEINRLQELKQVDITVDERARDVLAAYAHARTLDEGARGAPRAINEHIITPTVDLLTDLLEQGKDIAGIKLQASGAGKDRVVLELQADS